MDSKLWKIEGGLSNEDHKPNARKLKAAGMQTKGSFLESPANG